MTYWAIPVFWKCTSAAGKCSGLNTSQVLLGLGWCPFCGHVASSLYHYLERPGSSPPAEASSAYHPWLHPPESCDEGEGTDGIHGHR